MAVINSNVTHNIRRHHAVILNQVKNNTQYCVRYIDTILSRDSMH